MHREMQKAAEAHVVLPGGSRTQERPGVRGSGSLGRKQLTLLGGLRLQGFPEGNPPKKNE